MSVADTVALRVQGLHKSFDRLVVLRGIDLDVGEHEVVCLIGASGSGKSTFLRCINLLETIDAAATFNYTSFTAAALLFVALTIPLARFTDWLVLRDRRRRQATGT